MESRHEDKYILKYSALEHDFEELQQEAEEVISQLQRAKEAKRLLQAEVRFLRRRAVLLRERTNSKLERVLDPYFINDAGGEVSCQSGYQTIPQLPSRKPTKRAKHGKGENVHTRPSKSSSSSKQRAGIDNYSPPKRKGGSSNKRKISWKDDYSIQV